MAAGQTCQGLAAIRRPVWPPANSVVRISFWMNLTATLLSTASLPSCAAGQLDLTEIQKSDLNHIMTDLADRIKETHTESNRHHREFAELVRKERISREDMDRIVDDRLNRMKELADLVTERGIEFHAGLTSDQREKMVKLIEKYRTIHQGWFR